MQSTLYSPNSTLLAGSSCRESAVNERARIQGACSQSRRMLAVSMRARSQHACSQSACVLAVVAYSAELFVKTTRMTESPRRNILLMNRSLLEGEAFFLPFPLRADSVHI